MADKPFYRQIHPDFVHNDRVTSQAFNPGKHEQLSVYDSEIFDPKAAWEHYKNNENDSEGVMAVTDAECKAQDLTVDTDSIGYWGHAVINFGNRSLKVKKNIARSLAADARKRGWCYRPT